MSNNNGYYGDFGSWAEEKEAYEKHMEEQEQQREQEPNVVPCFKCNCEMYEKDNDPKLNVCEQCEEIKL